MGGYDIGASLSGSSSATSGFSGDFRNLFGAVTSGGQKQPPWLFLAAIAAVAVVAVVFVIRKT